MRFNSTIHAFCQIISAPPLYRHSANIIKYTTIKKRNIQLCCRVFIILGINLNNHYNYPEYTGYNLTINLKSQKIHSILSAKSILSILSTKTAKPILPIKLIQPTRPIQSINPVQSASPTWSISTV